MKKNQRGSSIILFILIVLILIVAYIIYDLYVNNDENSIDYAKYYHENVENTENEAKGYYYNQLEEPSKIMYTSILANLDLLKNGNEKILFPSELEKSIKETGNEEENYFQSAWDALSLDNLELFYIDTNKLSLSTKKMTLLAYKSSEYTLEPREEATYYSESFTNRDQIEDALNKINNIADDIISNASGTVYDKVKYVHDWIVDNISYDTTNNGKNKDNIYGTFVDKSVVCEGYAEAFKYLLDKLNIPCILVYGTGFDNTGNSEAHAWNYVKMPDNKWYAVDVTWDDPIYVGMPSAFQLNTRKYENFLKGSEDFLKTHVEDGDVSGTGQKFKYPELSKIDYK